MPGLKRKRPAPTRKSRTKRRLFRRKIRGAPRNRLTTQRWVFGGDVAGNDLIPSGSFTKVFKLDDMPNHGEFTALFDQYKIVGIKYRWVCVKDPQNANTVANQGFFPRVMWVHDHDSAQAVASFAELQQYANVREVYFSESVKKTRWMYLKPAVANSIYNGTYNGYNARWRVWCDSGYPAVPHYGLRAYFSELYTGVTVRLECKYQLQLKTVI